MKELGKFFGFLDSQTECEVVDTPRLVLAMHLAPGQRGICLRQDVACCGRYVREIILAAHLAVEIVAPEGHQSRISRQMQVVQL